ncbi:hypothetical protein DID88_005237 [Monilinia fructigena]|uniref:Cytochrome P450 n=1 Tax=Monilinia fructigena TaxID=38457 RepID=A0A395J1I9_9HELO|nr:hypothetical protein DID88_005237 [Monilinia fructigena]
MSPNLDTLSRHVITADSTESLGHFLLASQVSGNGMLSGKKICLCVVFICTKIWSSCQDWSQPCLRLKPRSNPSYIRREHRGFPKATTYGILQPQLDGYDLHNIFSTQDVEYHSVHKRIIGGLYTTSALKDVQNNIDRCTTLFVSQLEGLTRFQPTIVDMSAWLQFMPAFDSLLDVMFSKQIGFLATGSDVDGICEFDHQMMVYFSIWSQVPKLERIISRWKSLTGSLKPNPLYSVVREVIGAVYINVIAAHDVTAITLRTVFYHLSRSPAIHRKLYDEIAEADRLGLISHPARHSEVSSAPYLSAVINEALRIHPGVGTIPERVVPRGGVELHGVEIPEGTIIGVHTWAVNRSKEIFGEGC